MYVNRASVTNTCLPTGTSVNKKNHYFYWFERLKNVDTVCNRVALPERLYVAEELANVLQTSINNASWFGDHQYSCTYNQDKQTITILRPADNARNCVIPSDTLLAQPAFQTDVGTSANLELPALLQLLGQGGFNTSQEAGAIDIRRVHNVYVHSNSLSNNNVIGTDGGRTTLVKIPVLGQIGDVLHRYHSGHACDFVDVSNKTLATLDFELKGGMG